MTGVGAALQQIESSYPRYTWSAFDYGDLQYVNNPFHQSGVQEILKYYLGAILQSIVRRYQGRFVMCIRSRGLDFVCQHLMTLRAVPTVLAELMRSFLTRRSIINRSGRKNCTYLTTSFPSSEWLRMVNRKDASYDPLGVGVLVAMAITDPYAATTATDITYSYNPCLPSLSVPPKIFSIDPEWASCLPGISAFYVFSSKCSPCS